MKTLIRNVKLFDGTALAPRPMDVLFDESGILAEDFAVAEFVDSSKLELQRIVREGLDILRKENS